MPASARRAKLLHVVGRMRPGGIASFVEANLALNGTAPGQHDLLLTFADGIAPQVARGRIHRLDYSRRRLVHCLRRVWSIYREYDAIAVHGAHPVVVLPLLLSRKRCLLFQHGMSVSSGPAARRLALKVWHSALARLLAARVICSSPYAVGKARALGIRIPRSKVVIVPFGTAIPRRRRPARRAAAAQLVVGMAGRLEPQKRQALVLESLKTYRGARPIVVLIAGDGSERERLSGLAAELRREHVEVQLLGVVPDMAGFYDRLDLLILPSAAESLGLVVLEALRRSVPVAVFRDVGGCLPLVADGRTGFVLDDGIAGLHALWRRIDGDPGVLDRITSALSAMDLSDLHVARTRDVLDRLATADVGPIGAPARADRAQSPSLAVPGV